jgi:hypothetical protein
MTAPESKPCRECDGRGTILPVHDRVTGKPMSSGGEIQCPVCKGTGLKPDLPPPMA